MTLLQHHKLQPPKWRHSWITTVSTQTEHSNLHEGGLITELLYYTEVVLVGWTWNPGVFECKVANEYIEFFTLYFTLFCPGSSVFCFPSLQSVLTESYYCNNWNHETKDPQAWLKGQKASSKNRGLYRTTVRYTGRKQNTQADKTKRDEAKKLEGRERRD